MEYNLYHDESQEAGYWHGILLVPTLTRGFLLDEMDNVRNNLKYFEPVRLKGLNKPSGKQFHCVRSWLSIGVCAIIQRLKSDPCGFQTGKIIHNSTGKRTFEYQTLKNKIGAKFILFRVKDNHTALLGFKDYGAKIETTLRMGLKGGIHLLGNEQEPIHIQSFHFDGHEHFGRHIDLNRIVKRITNLREYCSFASPLILDDRTPDHRDPVSQDYGDCQLLQLTDLLVGTFRTVLGESKNKIQTQVAFPVKQLVDRWQQGRGRMRNSRWFGGFSISQCYLDSDRWVFEDINLQKGLENQSNLFSD